MTLRFKGWEVSLRTYVDGVPAEAVPMRLDNIEITLPEPTPPARTRLTLDDWIAAKAPLDHAPPCPEAAYVFVDGAWVQDWPIPGSEPIRRTLSPMCALWCYSVSQQIGG